MTNTVEPTGNGANQTEISPTLGKELELLAGSINASDVLDNLQMLMKSNMAGDGKYSVQQMNSHVKMTNSYVSVVRMQIQLYKVLTGK